MEHQLNVEKVLQASFALHLGTLIMVLGLIIKVCFMNDQPDPLTPTPKTELFKAEHGGRVHLANPAGGLILVPND